MEEVWHLSLGRERTRPEDAPSLIWSIIMWIKLLIGLSRCFLLCAPARGALTHRAHSRLCEGTFHREMLLMRLTGGGYDRVLGQRQPVALEIFL